MRKLLWSIGAPDGRSDCLVDNYKEPNLPGDVCWRVPNGVLFKLNEPVGTYQLTLHYSVVAPRLAAVEIRVNGVSGFAYLRPEPSEGTAEVLIPGVLLRSGENRLELVARDPGEVVDVNRAGFLYHGIKFEQVAGKFDELEPRAVMVPSGTCRRGEDGALVEDCHIHLELPGAIEASNLVLSLETVDRTEEMLLQVPAVTFGHLRIPFALFDGEPEGEVWWRLNGRLNRKLWSDRGIVRRAGGRI